jgi:hypothetical protein
LLTTALPGNAMADLVQMTPGLTNTAGEPRHARSARPAAL